MAVQKEMIHLTAEMENAVSANTAAQKSTWLSAFISAILKAEAEIPGKQQEQRKTQ